LEFKFENHIWNLFELIQTGGKVIKLETDRIQNQLGLFQTKTERAGPENDSRRAGFVLKQTDKGVPPVRSLNFPEPVRYRWIKI
jgi:hypothetical protein